MTLSLSDQVLLIAGALCFVFGASNFVSGENRLRIASLGLALVTISFVF